MYEFVNFSKPSVVIYQRRTVVISTWAKNFQNIHKTSNYSSFNDYGKVLVTLSLIKYNFSSFFFQWNLSLYVFFIKVYLTRVKNVEMLTEIKYFTSRLQISSNTYLKTNALHSLKSLTYLLTNDSAPIFEFIRILDQKITTGR